MKYKRNSGRKKQVEITEQRDESVSNTNRSKSINKKVTKQQLNLVAQQIVKDAKWLKELSEMPEFSREWVDKVALELLFQCMGKKEIISTNMFGQQYVSRSFNGKAALQVFNTIAKMNGHLFDTIKGTVKQTGTIEHNHQHQIELKPDTNRTIEVFNILESCGALNPPKRLTKEDVEVISA